MPTIQSVRKLFSLKVVDFSASDMSDQNSLLPTEFIFPKEIKISIALSFHLNNEKCINCANLLLFECQSTCYQKAVKVPLKVRPNLRLSSEKNLSYFYVG